MTKSSAPLARLYYGWYVIGMLALVGAVAYGAGVYAFTLFMPPLAEEFGWTRGEISSSISLFWLSAPLVPLIGAICEKAGARRLIIIGAIIEGCCLILIGFVTELWQLYLLRIAMGAGKIVMVMPIPIVVGKWFCDRCSTALGIAIAGWHLGGLVLTPITQYLIDEFSWRVAAYVLGGVFFVTIIPAALIVLRIKGPADLGLAPDGLTIADGNAEDVRRRIDTTQAGDTFLSVSRNWLYWAILAITTIYYLGYMGVLSQESAYLRDIGMDSMAAAGALGATAAFAAAGVIVFGMLLEKHPVKSILLLVLGVFSISLFILNMLGMATSSALLYLFTLLFGLAIGAGDVIWMTLLRTCFGNREYGAIFGVWYLVALIAMTMGPIVYGFVYDAMGSYAAPMKVITLFSVVCVAAVWALPIRSAAAAPAGKAVS